MKSKKECGEANTIVLIMLLSFSVLRDISNDVNGISPVQWFTLESKADVAEKCVALWVIMPLAMNNFQKAVNASYQTFLISESY